MTFSHGDLVLGPHAINHVVTIATVFYSLLRARHTTKRPFVPLAHPISFAAFQCNGEYIVYEKNPEESWGCCMRTTLLWDESHNSSILLLTSRLYPVFGHYAWSWYGHLPKLNICYSDILFCQLPTPSSFALFLLTFNGLSFLFLWFVRNFLYFWICVANI